MCGCLDRPISFGGLGQDTAAMFRRFLLHGFHCDQFGATTKDDRDDEVAQRDGRVWAMPI